MDAKIVSRFELWRRAEKDADLVLRSHFSRVADVWADMVKISWGLSLMLLLAFGPVDLLWPAATFFIIGAVYLASAIRYRSLGKRSQT